MRVVFVAVLALVTSLPAFGGGPDYQVEKGDTLWDLSGRFWGNVEEWPELWALNPQFHNPHFIYPGDPIFLGRAAPEGFVVHLPLERLQPAAVSATAGTAGAMGETAMKSSDATSGSGARTFHITSQQALDFVTTRPVARLGTVDNRHQVKVAYAEGEDVEFDLGPGAPVGPGDRLTVFDDGESVIHPVTGKPWGYFVHVLGQLEVRSVNGGRGVGRLLVTYDSVEAGAGLMAYREPTRELRAQRADLQVDGVILRGEPYRILFATNDAVFLDRGSAHGLQPGVLLQIPVQEGERAAQGMVDLEQPLATLVVATVQEESATGIVVDSRAGLEAGSRFVVAAHSP